MKVHTLNSHFNLYEFHFYIDQSDENTLISVLDLLIESDDLDLIKDSFTNIFTIETDNQTYVFSNYDLSEYYTVGDGLIKVTCVK